MKVTQFILLFTLVGFCLNDDSTCNDAFLAALPAICPNNLPGSNTKDCLYHDKKCLSITTCSEGDRSEGCGLTLIENFSTKKCVNDENDSEKCKSEPELRKCDDYNNQNLFIVDGISFLPKCEDLSAGEDGKRCDLDNRGCQPFYDNCDGITQPNCASNIPKDYSTKCVWKNVDGTNKCTSEKRECENDDYLLYYHSDEKETETFCQKLKATGATNGEQCHSAGSNCKVGFRICGDYTGEKTAANCLNVKPIFLDDGETPFDEIYHKCVPNADSNPTKCISQTKKCNEYAHIGNCEYFEATDKEKKCVYDSNYNPNNCKEEYKTCDSYFNKASGTKNKAKCEGFNNCVWEKKNKDDTEGTCREPYETCEEFNTYFKKGYEDFDKKKCELIGGRNKCILDKDRNCVTVPSSPILCTDISASDQYVCENVAQPSDPERRYCEYISGQCIENYMYCSDYRPVSTIFSTTEQTICERIKPFNEAGNAIEEDYKCVYDDDSSPYIGCYRTKKACKDATSDEQCARLCPALTTANTYYKYVSYSSEKCVPHYITCANALVEGTKCTGNIPKAGGQCEVDSSNPTKCKDKVVPIPDPPTPECDSYITEATKKETCEKLSSENMICYYSAIDTCSTKRLASCSDYLKSDFPNLDEAFCNKIEVGTNKKCSLKTNGKGCEEVDLYPNCPEQLNPQNPENQCSASRLRVYGIQLIIILLSLLI